MGQLIMSRGKGEMEKGVKRGVGRGIGWDGEGGERNGGRDREGMRKAERSRRRGGVHTHI